ncbi:MAG: MBOAT family O-acyltransferase [Salibacteraceae bacterium]
MLFSSAIFIVWFLPLFIIAYLLAPYRFKNAVALAGSFLFYVWGAPIFYLILLVSASIDYFLSKRMASQTSQWPLVVGIGMNVATLFVFKYFNFFIDNARTIVTGLGMNFPIIAEIALPLGISFFTFQKISYLIDVRRNECLPAKNIFDYYLFVFLFPQLIAGPIVRYKELESQIKDRRDQDNAAFKLGGFQRFALGLAKKVLIADTLATVADQAFSNTELGVFSSILGLMAYAFQIYYDFSGYTDMAIGLGMLMGFRFPENFNWPYLAHGFRDFWRRWHITLSTWMRDYLYHPLGGNRGTHAQVIRNLWIVFLLSGLWHGASWNFVIWGVWHGLFITIDRYTRFFSRMPQVPAALLTFALVCFGWIWFRAPDLFSAMDYYERIFSFETNASIEVSSRQWFILIIATVFAFLPAGTHQWVRSFHGDNQKAVLLKTTVAVAFLVLCLGQIAISESQPFIYFRF